MLSCSQFGHTVLLGEARKERERRKLGKKGKEGEARKKSSHLLITYFSFLCPWSYRKNRQVRQGIVRLKDLKCALGPERESMRVPGLKDGYSIALRKWQERGPPAKADFRHMQRKDNMKTQKKTAIYKPMKDTSEEIQLCWHLSLRLPRFKWWK